MEPAGVKPESGGRARVSWSLCLVAAALVAAARAVLFAAMDRYSAAGLPELAASSMARNFLEGVVPCGIGAVLLALTWTRRRRGLGLAGSLLAVGGAYLFLSGRLPYERFHAPGFDRPYARLGHLAALLASVAGAALLGFAPRIGRLPRRGLGAAALVLVAGAASVRVLAGSRSSAERPNVILISIDTLRADRLGLLGYPLPTTPEIDRFFSHASVRFEQAFAPQPFTLTSHMTLLTGMDPAVHGVDAERALPADIPTLASTLSENGYLTVAQTDPIQWLDPRFGFARGFRLYRRLAGSARWRSQYLEPLLDDLEDQRFFLFLHYYDAHSDRGPLPYDSAPGDRALLADWYQGDLSAADVKGGGTGLLWRLNDEGIAPSEEDRHYLGSLYDASLRTLDRALGGLFRQLESSDLLERTLVVFTADHGEELFEHGRCLHSQVYDECLRVPLLFRLPGRDGVEVRTELVSLMDVAPTLLDLCGIPPPSETAMQGRSLRRLLEGSAEPWSRALFFEWKEPGLRTSSWKVIRAADGWKLFDLRQDAGERHDLLADGPPPSEGAALIRLFEEEERRRAELKERVRAAGQAAVTLTESELENLRSLGYAGDD